MGVLAAAFGVSAANHLRSEESAGHTEALLATATTRIRWASSHFVFALAGVAVLMLLAGVSIGAGAAVAVRTPGWWAAAPWPPWPRSPPRGC